MALALHHPQARTTTRRAVDITVLGAGCFGLSAALALAEDGHGVTIVDRNQPGAGSTAKAAGICSTMTWNDDDAQLIAQTRGLLGEIISLTAGVEPAARGAWRSFDSITVAKGEGLQALDAMQDRLERMTEEPERLGHREAAATFHDVQFEPGEEVLVAQEDGVIEAGDFLAAMLARLEQEGVAIRSGPRTAAPESEGIVVACGPWCRDLLVQRDVRLPLRHYRTQLANVQIPSDGLPIVHDAVHGFYTRPESAASVLAGDGTVLQDHDIEDFNEAGDPEFHTFMAERVVQRFRHGGDARIRRSWAGLCVATPDRRPMCGPAPDHDRLWVLTGDNGFGLMRCLALGERLARAVDGDVDDALDPRRFGDDWDPEFPMREGFAF